METSRIGATHTHTHTHTNHRFKLSPSEASKPHKNPKISRLVSLTSLASPPDANTAQRRGLPACRPAVRRARTSHTHTHTHTHAGVVLVFDLPVLCADGVVVKRQQVRGGYLPPFCCSGTRGASICTLSQPSL